MENLEPKTELSFQLDQLIEVYQGLQNSRKLGVDALRSIGQIVHALGEVINEFDFYDKHPLYKLMHEHLNFMHSQHKEIKSFIIKVNLSPDPGLPAFFEYNFFSDATR